MKKLKWFILVFFIIAFSSITFLLIENEKNLSLSIEIKEVAEHIEALDNSEFLNSMWSALGGFSSGGLLLLFLIKRLITHYDTTFSKWENTYSSHIKKQNDENLQILEAVEDLKSSMLDLKIKIVTIQSNTVNRDLITEAITKTEMLEIDITQMQNEIRSITNKIDAIKGRV